MTGKRIIARIRKVLSLAENGVAGEKDNAQRILQKLLDKYGLSMSDIIEESQDIVVAWYNYKDRHHKDLLMYCVATVTNKTVTSWVPRHGHAKKLAFKLVAGDHLEVAAMYEYYKKLWNDELKTFYKAFVGKHGLGSSVSGRDGPKTGMSDEELEKLMAYFRGLQQSEYVSRKKMLMSQHD